jgi:hypothetical protein
MKKNILLATVLLISISACNLPAARTLTPPVAPSTGTPTATTDVTQCAYMWATQSLPDLSGQVQAAMQANVQPEAEARAEAYGEDCVAPDGTRTGFGAMETDYRITLKVTDLNDTAALGSLAEAVLKTLAGFPVGSTPGPNPGYVGIRYVAGDHELNLWFLRQEGQALLEQGLKGATLFDALYEK